MLGARLERGRRIAERHARHLERDRGSFSYDKFSSLCHFVVRGKRVPYEVWLETSKGIWRKTRCFCSACCGNPRTFYGNSRQGMTLQERRETQRERY